ncbi:cell division protein FtsA, partial [bacterium]|nr:cell division protein FtsA [bacterium]
GVAELAEFVFDLPVKLAAPERIDGFSELVAAPNYSTAVGLVHWASLDKKNFSRLPLSQSSSIKRAKRQVQEWWENFF